MFSDDGLRAGILSGLCVAAIFNPYDRALYVATINARPFLDPRNWGVANLTAGFIPNAIQKCVSYGLYFPVEAAYKKSIRRVYVETQGAINEPIARALSGQMTGATLGLMVNVLTLEKYRQWMANNTETQQSAKMDLRTMFTRGVLATVLRDSIFGGTFTTLRGVDYYEKVFGGAEEDDGSFATRASSTSRTAAQREHLRQNDEPSPSSSSSSSGAGYGIESRRFFNNWVAAYVATTLSSPLNYARNVQYSGDDRGLRAIFRQTWQECKADPNPARHIFLRFRIGWGSARVGVGMALGDFFYGYFSKKV